MNERLRRAPLRELSPADLRALAWEIGWRGKVVLHAAPGEAPQINPAFAAHVAAVRLGEIKKEGGQ